MKKIALIVLVLLTFACSNNKVNKNNIIIGITDEITTLNPMFAFNTNEGEISELLYLQPVKHSWDDKLKLVPKALLAREWKWLDKKSLLLVLKNDLKWSDGKPITVNDIVFSFELYSHPEAKGKFYGMFTNYPSNENGSINSDKAFTIISPDSLKISFAKESSPTLFDVDFPVLPKHYFSGIELAELVNSPKNLKPVSSGPYLLKENSNPLTLTLLPDTTSTFCKPGTRPLEFKVISNYNSGVMQLEFGEIDLFSNLRKADADRLAELPNIATEVVTGRIYDYIGLQLIDWQQFNETNEYKSHKLFGNKKLRTAISSAINRNEIISEVLNGAGTLCNSPVSPLFLESTIPAKDNFDPTSSKALLDELGWKDTDNDGIRDKDGNKLSVRFGLSASNPVMQSVATFVQKYLKDVGIEAVIEPLEYSIYFEKLSKREMDAWVGGWFVPIPMDLLPSWRANLETKNFNFSGYRNNDLEKLLKEYNETETLEKQEKLLGNIHSIFVEEKPAIFLYWLNDITAYNKSVKNIDINPLGVIQYCWEWEKN